MDMRGMKACLWRDWRIGRPYIAIACAAAAFTAITEGMGGYETMLRASSPEGGSGLMCFLGFALYGIPPVGEGQQFVLPIGWIALMLSLSLPACLFPAYDMGTPRCSQALVRTSRGAWWWSKIIWSVGSWAAAFATLCVVSALAEVSPSGGPSPAPLPGGASMPSLVSYAAVASLTVSVLGCVASLVFGSIAGVCSLVVFLVASSYFTSPLLFANFAMLARTSLGAIALPPPECFFVLLPASAFAAAGIGLHVFNRRDRLE